MNVLDKPKKYSAQPGINSICQKNFETNNPFLNVAGGFHLISITTVFSDMDYSHQMSVHNRKMIQNIKRFERFESNWDSYGAEKPSDAAIKSAIEFVRRADADGIQIYFAAPGPNGEIVLELKHNHMNAELYFNPGDDTEVLIYKIDDCIAEGTLDDIYEQLLNHFSSHVGV